ncbi:unnamed protein product [marine sediment metagenome]|uniref:Uncharacterized protein n=1 Tax=marine sediment metagenome TaxID=412755 RepID=X1SP10_9ZZZZ
MNYYGPLWADGYCAGLGVEATYEIQARDEEYKGRVSGKAWTVT